MKSFFKAVLLTLLLPTFVTALLTQDEINFYEQNGFLVIPNFYTEEDCDNLKNRMAEMVETFDESSVRSIFADGPISSSDPYFLNSGGNVSFFFEEGAFAPDGSLKYPKELCLNKVGHAMHDLDPQFNDFSRAPKLAALTSDLGVPNPLLIQSMYIFKQPYIGGEVTCHQDSAFIISEPNTTIGYWIAIEDATIENGCLWVIPGEHKSPLKILCVRNGDHTEFLTFDNTPWSDENLIPIEVKKGTLIVLHGHLPHLSYMNTSPKSRHAFTLHVIDESSSFPESNWLRRAKDFPFKSFAKSISP